MKTVPYNGKQAPGINLIRFFSSNENVFMTVTHISMRRQ